MEIWKDIKWYELLYKVSNLWNIKSLPKKWKWWHNWIIMKQCIDSQKKYLTIGLSKNKKRKTYLVHILVLQTFKENLLNKKTVNHIDWNTLNNNLKNLEWMTYSENHKHAYKKLWRVNPMQWKFWTLHHWSKEVNQYNLKWDFIQTWNYISEANRFFKVSHNHISSCCNWKRKTCLWFIWKFKN